MFFYSKDNPRYKYKYKMCYTHYINLRIAYNFNKIITGRLTQTYFKIRAHLLIERNQQSDDDRMVYEK